MKNSSHLPVSSARMVPKRGAQEGVLLAVTLIVLVILLVSSVAIVRSFNASTAVSGALALRRDLVNQSERGISQVISQNFKSTAPNLLSQPARWSNQSAFNYSACQLPADVHGVPTILSDDANFTNTTDLSAEPWSDSVCKGAAVAVVSNDITDPVTGIVVRYVVDRLCAQTGAFTASNCSTTPVSQVTYRDVNAANVNSPAIPIYRISIRAKDPKGATTYLQTTFSN